MDNSTPTVLAVLPASVPLAKRVVKKPSVMLATSVCGGKGYANAFLPRVVRSIEGVAESLVVLDGVGLGDLGVDVISAFDHFDLSLNVPGKPFVPVGEGNTWSHRMQRITRVREAARRLFLETRHTHLYFHDSDMAPPVGIVGALLSHRRPVVSGAYLLRNVDVPLAPAYSDGMTPLNGDLVFMAETSETAAGAGTPDPLREVRGFGMGCMLIERASLERTPFRTPEMIARQSIGEDYAWCVDSGESVGIDLEQCAWHVGDNGCAARVQFGQVKQETVWIGCPQVVVNRHGAWTRGVPKYGLNEEIVQSLPPGFVTRPAREIIIERKHVEEII